MSETQTRPWWKQADSEYEHMLTKWRTTEMIYQADPDQWREEGKLLVQKKQGEHSSNYSERCELANPVPLLAVIVDAYSGRAQEAEKKIMRRFNRDKEEGLGSDKDTSTLAGRIWRNADGKGLNYLPLLANVATELSIKKCLWGFVEGVRKDDSGAVISDPLIRMLPPENVPITIENEAGDLVGAVVHHTHCSRGSAYEPEVSRDRYTVYSLDGYAIYEIQKKKTESGDMVEEAVRVDGGQGDDPIPYGADFYYFDTPDRNMNDRILPLYRISMPGRRYPGYTLANQNIVYFNHSSELQNKHRACNILKLQVVFRDNEDIATQRKEITDGSSVMWIPHDSSRDNKFIEPGAQSLAETREWLGQMRGEFLFSALREYEDSVKGTQKTATEAAQDAAQGEHSYLNALAGALDEFEMQAWKRIEQIEWPNDPKMWGQFFVERKKDFRPLDEEGETSRLQRLFFGGDRIPIGSKGRADIAKRIAEAEDVEFDETELAAEIAQEDTANAQFDALASEFGV